MSLSKYAKLSTSEIADKPHQPLSFMFAKRQFGKKTVLKRYFQPPWFSRWKWLYYNEGRALAFCFTCMKAYTENKLCSATNLETMYISTGYGNWKDASVTFAAHEASTCHKDAILKTITLPATTRNIGESTLRTNLNAVNAS